jgi:hypothetical protein
MCDKKHTPLYPVPPKPSFLETICVMSYISQNNISFEKHVPLLKDSKFTYNLEIVQPN